MRFSDEELKHQELFRRLEMMMAPGMPAGYRFMPSDLHHLGDNEALDQPMWLGQNVRARISSKRFRQFFLLFLLLLGLEIASGPFF